MSHGEVIRIGPPSDVLPDVSLKQSGASKDAIEEEANLEAPADDNLVEDEEKVRRKIFLLLYDT